MARVAIVTGAASGIGYALCSALSQRGVDVLAADIDAEGVVAAAKELDARGRGGVEPVGLDVRDAAAVQSAVDQVVDRHGRLDFIFNNAGIGVGGNVEELTVDHWDRAIDVNIRGVVHGVQAAYPVMVRQGFGHIVNTASSAAFIPFPGIAPYGMTKWAVLGLSLSLRAEAADKGVRVSAVCPGAVDTPILDKGNPPDVPAVPSADALDARAALTRTPFGRIHAPDAMARDILRGVARNRALIIAPAPALALYHLSRLAPRTTARFLQREYRAREQHLRAVAVPLGPTA